MTLQEKIAALPEWPKEENYATPMTLGSGIQITYSYPADEVRCLSDQLDAALARLALARELIAQGTPHHSDCERIFCEASSCTCGRDALLKALETP